MIATTGSLTPACTLLVVTDNVAAQSVTLEHAKRSRVCSSARNDWKS